MDTLNKRFLKVSCEKSVSVEFEIQLLGNVKLQTFSAKDGYAEEKYDYLDNLVAVMEEIHDEVSLSARSEDERKQKKNGGLIGVDVP